MQHASPDYLARRFFGWWAQGDMCHQLLRHLHRDAQVIEYPGDGTVLLRVDAAAWLASQDAAAAAPPEPLDGATRSTNGGTTRSSTRNGKTRRSTAGKQS